MQQLSREGVIPKATRGQYDLIGSVRGYVRYLREQAVRAQAGAPDYAVERARLIRARADLSEMEAEARRGALIAADDIEAAWIAVLAQLRTRLLALPDRLAPVVHAQESPAGVREVIREAIREALEEMAEADVRVEEESDGIGPDPEGWDGALSDGAARPGGADAAAGPDNQ
ncbi:terminase small subunit, Nu1 [Thalassobius vesicularis]|uniref:terminase small subunit, Nu1 n=1 Tax=Thalassobius vesicularis TaxID=1294297 RepID=UPI001FED1E55|nr:terminase small subunit, Nu1 [Thalassobius vesicularis]